MNTRTAACGALIALAALTAGCSSTEASPAACKAAMVEQLKQSDQQDGDSKRPAACEGIDDKTVRKLAGEAMNEWLESDDAKKKMEDAFEDAVGDTPPDASDLEQDLGDIQKDLDELNKELDEASTAQP